MEQGLRESAFLLARRALQARVEDLMALVDEYEN